VTPGIRPVENRPSDDQKRVVTVEQAFADGANYIVVGRPIRDAKGPPRCRRSHPADYRAAVFLKMVKGAKEKGAFFTRQYRSRERTALR
jgi:hypothetical protein